MSVSPLPSADDDGVRDKTRSRKKDSRAPSEALSTGKQTCRRNSIGVADQTVASPLTPDLFLKRRRCSLSRCAVVNLIADRRRVAQSREELIEDMATPIIEVNEDSVAGLTLSKR
mmetsp:Transcript_34420/g.75348  ORF Transcript_34420/g.75348 Transcript_34420/m.75348 type:complete len:115 (-) Transcript_34420:1103-1447(-)